MVSLKNTICLALLVAGLACLNSHAQSDDRQSAQIEALHSLLAQHVARSLDAIRFESGPEADGAVQEVLEWQPGRTTGRVRREQDWQPAGAALLVQTLGADLLRKASPGTRGLWLDPMVWVECEQVCMAYRISESAWIGALLGEQPAFDRLPLVILLKDAAQQSRRIVHGEVGDSHASETTPIFKISQLIGPEGWNWHVQLNRSPGIADDSNRIDLLAAGLVVMLLLIGTAAYLMALSRRDKRRAEEQIRFVASATHELRTPLSVIDGAADSLAVGIVSDTRAVSEYGSLIRTESRRLASLVNNVLQFSSANQQLSNIESIDISEWIQGAIAMGSGDSDRVSVETFEPLPVIRGNRAALDSLMVNLVRNAMLYSDDKQAAIEVQAITRPGSQQALAVSVVNRVSGRIDSDAQDWFEPFRRGRNGQHQQGTGLGLSVARTIARQHGGDISLRVSDNRVRLTVFLPEAAHG